MSWRERWENLAQRIVDNIYDVPRYQPGEEARRPRLVAHRGCWNMTTHWENTIPAFYKARDLGAWAIEFDVRFTRDNVPVINHDRDLVRGHAAKGEIHQLTLMNLHARAPRIPQLKDVLCMEGLHFMIEIKEPLTSSQKDALAEHLKPFTPVVDYHFLTLRPEIVEIDSRFPAEAWILVGDLNIKSLLAVAKTRPVGGLAGHYVTVSDQVLQELNRAHMKAGTGFIPSFNVFRREWSRGVTWAFTNHLEKIVRDENWKSG